MFDEDHFPTATDINFWLQHVSVYEDRIILMRALPGDPSVHLLRVLYERAAELAAGWDRFGMLIDLIPQPNTSRPDAAGREFIRDWHAAQGKRVRHVAVVIGDNPMQVVIVRFIMTALKVPSTSTHRTFAEGLAAVRSALVEQVACP